MKSFAKLGFGSLLMIELLLVLVVLPFWGCEGKISKGKFYPLHPHAKPALDYSKPRTKPSDAKCNCPNGPAVCDTKGHMFPNRCIFKCRGGKGQVEYHPVACRNRRIVYLKLLT